MRKSILSIIVILLTTVVFAQTDYPVAMGKWRTHLAYNSVSQITQSSTSIYAISDGALFSVGKKDEDIQVFTKISGLNDVDIIKLEYDEINDQLLIIYKNGNIDLMHEVGVYNISDLFNKQMSSSKTINEVYFNGNFAYLSCDFGIVVLNLDKKEISDTYFIGPNASEIKVLSTTIHDNIIYALTEDGILHADANNRNLVNYEYWHQSTGLPGSGKFQKIFTFAGELLLLRNNKLYKREKNNTWSGLLSAITIKSLNVSGGKILVGNGTDKTYLLNESFGMSTIEIPGSSDIEYDQENKLYWLAGGELGVISYKFQANTDPIIEYYKPSGPAQNIPWSMTFAGEKLFVVNGGRWDTQNNRSGKIMIYENNSWKVIDESHIKPLTGRSALDFMNVAVDPQDDKHFFVTSYGTGLYEFRNDKFSKWHHHYNSTLNSIFPGTGGEYNYIRLDGAIFDENNNLWIANTSSPSPIKILNNEGEWLQLNYGEVRVPTLGPILISNQNQNQKWVLSVRHKPGIFIWDDNNTLTNESDDKRRFFSQFNEYGVTTPLNPQYIYCIAQDQNGVVWVGTDMGPLLFSNPSNAFDPDYTCSRVKIPRKDGTELADYLLQNEQIKAIVIDGANRKWLGTEESGLYLMSENGQETIHHFTSANSPLLSDNILSLALNPVSGELFIGTGNGLISYQTDAAESSNIYTDVYAYPNPVDENYNGVITIVGLINKTQVKITDLNGNLIYQTVSNGSIATWDGKDFHGRKVSTGIYFAICANEDGTQSTITKIMVIN
ncbi:MAG: T9SS type A sorting domain-containing protein [Bacteroidales bacterium]|nr:T9SS type A sorting domain-containing protein [Bacteroidales bacterium]